MQIVQSETIVRELTCIVKASKKKLLPEQHCAELSLKLPFAAELVKHFIQKNTVDNTDPILGVNWSQVIVDWVWHRVGLTQLCPHCWYEIDWDKESESFCNPDMTTHICKCQAVVDGGYNAVVDGGTICRGEQYHNPDRPKMKK
mgnify:CR=1 FL=1